MLSGLGKSLVGKGLAVQAQDLSSIPRGHTKELEVGRCMLLVILVLGSRDKRIPGAHRGANIASLDSSK